MTPLAVSLLLATAAAAQDAKPAALRTPVTACACISGPKITPQSFTGLESRFDSTLNSLNDRYPVDLLGGARALYLRDYGLTLSAEVSLVQTPSINPFRKEITEADRAAIHQRKLDQLPRLKQALREMVKTSALMLAGGVGLQGVENSGLQVVVSVKVLYLKWEDTTGLPAQIVMKADLKNAMAGTVTEEEQ